jgi:hypothetical protein
MSQLIRKDSAIIPIVGAVKTIIPDSGDDVTPNIAGEINLVGGDNINTVGDNATHTVTVNLDKSISQPDTNAAGTEGMYSLGSNRFMHNYGLDNTFLGEDSGNLTLTVPTAAQSVGIGYNSLNSVTEGFRNTGTGAYSLSSLTDGDMNSSVGAFSLDDITTGNQNSVLGDAGLSDLISGDRNCAIGASVGSAYIGAESNNILVGALVTGTLGESNVTRIGAAQNACYIDGIIGVTPAGVSSITVTDVNDQLGTIALTDGQLLIGSTGASPVAASITAGSNITVTPGAGTLTIAASVTDVVWQSVSGSNILVVNTGNIMDLGGLSTQTLPASPSLGDIIEIVNATVAVGVRISQNNANQRIRFGASTTTNGIGGYLESTQVGDTLKMVCTFSSVGIKQWTVVSSIGNWTIV